MRGSSVFFVAVLGAAIAACGGKSQNNSKDRDREVPSEAGAGPHPGTAEGDGGMGGAESDGMGGTAPRGGIGGTPTNGGTSNLGGMAAGAATEAGTDGGPSRGGAPSGGAPTVPVGGARNPADLMEAPPGCTPVGQGVREGECNYDFSCESGTHFAGCERASDGLWECQCGTFSSPTRYFEVEGAEGLEACGAAAHVCVTAPAGGDATTCRLFESSVDNDTCSARQSCGPALEWDGGITIRPVQHYRAECEQKLNAAGEHTEEFWCTCSGGELHGERFEVRGPSAEFVCEPMAAFCSRQEPPSASAPEQCALHSESANADGCSVVQRCGPLSEIADEIWIKSGTERSIYCRPGEGTSHCDCADGDLTFRFDADLDTTDIDACRDAVQLCSPKVPLEKSGPITCELTYQHADTDLCGSEVVCQQSVDIDGTTVTGYGALGMVCNKETQEGPWLCSCASTKTSAMFQLEPSTDIAGTCARATTRCQEEVEVFIGFSSGIAEPQPPPLP